MASSPSESGDIPQRTTPQLDPNCRVCDGARELFDSFAHFSSKHKNLYLPTSAVSRETANVSESTPSNSAIDTTLQCPPDTMELGRSAWTLLHTMAAYYPEQPTSQQQALMKLFMAGLAEFYPCHYCAEHLKEQVKASPPKVSSNCELSYWLCSIHNNVNERLGKPLFNCDNVFERWRDGPTDGSC